MIGPRQKDIALLLTLTILCSCISAVMGSPESYQEVLQGFTQLGQGNDSAALEKFQAAVALDPGDGQAWLFVGTAFNQLGQPESALAALTGATGLKYSDPELLFQTGRAEVLLGQNRKAIETLRKFDSIKPGRGQTSEFLGRAYTAAGDYTAADSAFRLALERDPTLRSTVLPYQANLAALEKNQQAELQNLEDLGWFSPGSATAGVLRDELSRQGRSLDDLAVHSPFTFSAGIWTGYSTNVQGVEVISVQGNNHGRSSIFDETSLAGSYTWNGIFAGRSDLPTASPDQLTLSAAALLDDYPQAEKGDFFTSSVSGEYDRRIAGPFSGSLRVSGMYDDLKWSSFHDSVAARAALQWRVTPRILMETAYTWTDDQYLYNPVPVQNPDADSNMYSLDGYFQLSSTATAGSDAVTLRIGGFFVTNRSKGADFDYDGGGINAGINFPLVEHVHAELLYTWTDDRYLNLNSLTQNVNDLPFRSLTYQRADFINSISIGLTRQMREWNRHLTLSASYAFSQASSNINAYRFSQQIVRVGLIWNM